MRQPDYVSEQDQLFQDFRGISELHNEAPDAVSITVDEYLNPQDIHRIASAADDDDLVTLNYWMICTTR